MGLVLALAGFLSMESALAVLGPLAVATAMRAIRLAAGDLALALVARSGDGRRRGYFPGLPTRASPREFGSLVGIV